MSERLLRLAPPLFAATAGLNLYHGGATQDLIASFSLVAAVGGGLAWWGREQVRYPNE